MVLELIAIGAGIYWYVKRNKQRKAQKAAFAANQPFVHKDGSVTFPSTCPDLPPAYRRSSYDNDGGYKNQVPVEVAHGHVREVYPYSDNLPAFVPYDGSNKEPMVVSRKESFGMEKKAPLAMDTKEFMPEKK